MRESIDAAIEGRTTETKKTTATPAGIGVMSFEQAISQAGQRINNKLNKKTPVVLHSIGSSSEKLSDFAIAELLEAVKSGGKLTVIDRKGIDVLRKEYSSQVYDAEGNENLQAVGSMLGAQSVITGSISDAANGAAVLEIRLFNVQSGAVELEFKTAMPGTVQETWDSITGAAHLTMLRVNGGTFTMGSPENEPKRKKHEGPQRQVTLSPFYMADYQVTQKEYRDLTGENPSGKKGYNLPVNNVSWFDALKYCNLRSEREKLTPAYTINGKNVEWDRSANGYRLPTEAEWEYACRAGTSTAFNNGLIISDNTGWYIKNSKTRPNPVGRKPPNALGLYDMHGNVKEWCWDRYTKEYPGEAQTDPVSASANTERVVRGGGYLSSGDDIRSAFRDKHLPALKLGSMGFRVVRN
jgi:formylglycine-generating enzyme required for sulfatase activity